MSTGQKRLVTIVASFLLAVAAIAVLTAVITNYKHGRLRTDFENYFYVRYSDLHTTKQAAIRETVIAELCLLRNQCLEQEAEDSKLEEQEAALKAKFRTPKEAKEYLDLLDKMRVHKEFSDATFERLKEKREVAYKAGFTEEAKLMGYVPPGGSSF